MLAGTSELRCRVRSLRAYGSTSVAPIEVRTNVEGDRQTSRTVEGARAMIEGAREQGEMPRLGPYREKRRQLKAQVRGRTSDLEPTGRPWRVDVVRNLQVQCRLDDPVGVDMRGMMVSPACQAHGP